MCTHRNAFALRIKIGIYVCIFSRCWVFFKATGSIMLRCVKTQSPLACCEVLTTDRMIHSDKHSRFWAQ